MSNIKNLISNNQSIWLDSISKQMLDSGDLSKIIDLGITGITSNPSIFDKAISSSEVYDETIREISNNISDPKGVFEELAIRDIQRASDLLFKIYKQSEGTDGFVSLEVDPFLANNTEETIKEAKRLWNRVNRENLMIKVPGTDFGFPAVQHLLESGININITLLFSFDSYKKCLQAFLQSQKTNTSSKSVASFFISRIDTAVDMNLENSNKLFHKIGIANSYKAFGHYLNSKKIMKNNYQKLLWASTSVKAEDLAPAYYCENFPISGTINTLPLETINDLLKKKDFNINKLKISEIYSEIMEDLDKILDLNLITQDLLLNGIKLFQDSYSSVLDTVNKKMKSIKKK